MKGTNDDSTSRNLHANKDEGVLFYGGLFQADGAQRLHGSLRNHLPALQRSAWHTVRLQVHDVLRWKVVTVWHF